jgi:hypothetical protein
VQRVVLFQAALSLLQPLGTRLRDRLRFGGAPLVEAALGFAQPAAPPLRRRQLPGQLVAAPVAVALVLGPVDRTGLGQNLAGDLVVGEILMLRSVRVQLRAIHRQHRHPDQTGVGAERQHIAEQTSQGSLVALAKARDRAVIGPLVGGDHPHRHIVEASAFDHPRRAAAGSVRVQQQRHHHRRIVRRTAMPVLAIGAIEPGQVHLLNRRQNEPREMVIRQPLTQARRQQQLLLTVTSKEVLGHDRIVPTGPDDTTPFVRQRAVPAFRPPLRNENPWGPDRRRRGLVR